MVKGKYFEAFEVCGIWGMQEPVLDVLPETSGEKSEIRCPSLEFSVPISQHRRKTLIDF